MLAMGQIISHVRRQSVPPFSCNDTAQAMQLLKSVTLLSVEDTWCCSLMQSHMHCDAYISNCHFVITIKLFERLMEHNNLQHYNIYRLANALMSMLARKVKGERSRSNMSTAI